MRKPGDIIHVHNDFREAPLYDLKPVEQNLMWVLMYEVKDKEIEELRKHKRVDIHVPVNKIAEESGYNKRLKNLEKDFDSIADTITSYKIPITDGKYRGKVVPFPIVKMDEDGTEIVVTVLIEFAQIIDYVFRHANFTKMSLKEIVGVNGKHAKIAYYHMSSYSDSGVWHVDFPEFTKIFNISDKYRAREVRRRIIAPILRECGEYFENLKYYEKEGTRHNIESIMFVFEPREVEDKLRQEVKRQSQLEQLKEVCWFDKTNKVYEAIQYRESEKERDNERKRKISAKGATFNGEEGGRKPFGEIVMNDCPF